MDLNLVHTEKTLAIAAYIWTQWPLVRAEGLFYIVRSNFRQAALGDWTGTLNFLPNTLYTLDNSAESYYKYIQKLWEFKPKPLLHPFQVLPLF